MEPTAKEIDPKKTIGGVREYKVKQYSPKVKEYKADGKDYRLRDVPSLPLIYNKQLTMPVYKEYNPSQSPKGTHTSVTHVKPIKSDTKQTHNPVTSYTDYSDDETY